MYKKGKAPIVNRNSDGKTSVDNCKIGKTFINYLKTVMKQSEHEIDNSISNIIK